jgi:hypothetical protein
MASVVTYWQVPEDERDFLDYLLKTGDVVAVLDEWVESRDLLRPVPIATHIERENTIGFQFALRHLLDVNYTDERQFDGKTQFCLSMRSNTISYRRGLLANGRLPQSNLSMYSAYPHDYARVMVARRDRARFVLGFVLKRGVRHDSMS